MEEKAQNWMERERQMKQLWGKGKRQYIGAKILLSLTMTAIFYLFYVGNLFSYANWSLQDWFFQREKDTAEEIVVIGVTAQDLETYGMWPWNRTVWARVLHAINNDTQTNPAAIGISIPFYGSSLPISDKVLQEELVKPNVVLGCNAEFQSQLLAGDTVFDADTQFIVSDITYPYVYPNPDIHLGHTNILYDSDGVLRHALLEVETEQGAKIPSMSYATFQMYAQYHGFPLDFKPKTDENGFWYVDYSAKTGGYFHYSIEDIISGNFDPADLAGKVVLIGVFDTTLMDYYRPAIDHSESMYGIEFMANCVDAMLRGKEIEIIDARIELAILLLGTFTITFLSLYLALPVVSVLVAFFCFAGLLLIAKAYEHGVLYPPFFLLIGLASCYSLAVAFNYWFEWYTKKHLTSVFKQYIDPKVMDALLERKLESLHTTGENSDIAVLFVDIRGFTSMSEKMDAETVVQILNRFLSLVDDSIKKYDGTLDKFIGDCAMAFWGAPEKMKDPAYNACCAAVDMVRESVKLRAEIEEKYHVSTAFGVGIHYGNAIVGNVGSSTRLDYTAIGDTVNTASRLESVAPPNTIYISSAVVKQLGKRGTVDRLMDSLLLKGKSKNIDIYVLSDIE